MGGCVLMVEGLVRRLYRRFWCEHTSTV